MVSGNHITLSQDLSGDMFGLGFANSFGVMHSRQ